jgi:Tol biopolymer transport system component
MLPASDFASTLQLSPDGQTLAFIRRDSQSKKKVLARVAIDASNYREIQSLTDGGNQMDHVAWDKDGRGILFGKQDGEEWKIMRIPAEGGKPEVSGFDHGKHTELQNISLSLDGKRLAFSANQSINEVWAVDNLLASLK